MNGPKPASGSMSPSLDPDADLIQHLAFGSPSQKSAALSALMDKYLQPIKSMAWHMLGDEMAAEDVAQEVFLRAWKHAPKWEPGRAKYATWMHRVGKNLCYDRLRKKTEIFSDQVPETVDKEALAPNQMIAEESQQERADLIAKAIQTLPETQRMAITLCHYQELSQKEAAEILDMSVRAYESLLARGRRNLRDRLSMYKSELIAGFGDET